MVVRSIDESGKRREWGTRLALLREAAGLTREDVKEILGYANVSSISLIESGRQEPSTSQLDALTSEYAGRKNLALFTQADCLGFVFGETMIRPVPKVRPTSAESSNLTDWSDGIRVLRPIIGEISPDLGKAA